MLVCSVPKVAPRCPGVMSELDIAPGAVCEGAKVEDIIARTLYESSLSKKGDPNDKGADSELQGWQPKEKVP